MKMPSSRSFHDPDLRTSGESEQFLSLVAEDHNIETNPPRHAPLGRQPSLVSPGTPRTPRTPNRVRFDIEDTRATSNDYIRRSSNESEASVDDEDYSTGGRRSSSGQRAPLLTDIEAPIVTTALELDVEGLLENARPKSGMSSAFMNMANSIIGAGIIGI